jgi:hypothetical protein
LAFKPASKSSTEKVRRSAKNVFCESFSLSVLVVSLQKLMRRSDDDINP